MPDIPKVEFNASVSQVHGKVDRWGYREQNGQTVVLPYQKQADQPTA